jgi:hypothetical protein
MHYIREHGMVRPRDIDASQERGRVRWEVNWKTIHEEADPRSNRAESLFPNFFD